MITPAVSKFTIWHNTLLSWGPPPLFLFGSPRQHLLGFCKNQGGSTWDSRKKRLLGTSCSFPVSLLVAVWEPLGYSLEEMVIWVHGGGSCPVKSPMSHRTGSDNHDWLRFFIVTWQNINRNISSANCLNSSCMFSDSCFCWIRVQFAINLTYATLCYTCVLLYYNFFL